MKILAFTGVFGLLVVIAAACGRAPEASPSPESPAAPVDRADQAILALGEDTYGLACAACHEGADPGAPQLAALQLMSPEAI